MVLNCSDTVGVVRKGLWRWIDSEHRSALSIILAKSISIAPITQSRGLRKEHGGTSGRSGMGSLLLIFPPCSVHVMVSCRNISSVDLSNGSTNSILHSSKG